ncbi:Flp family type IVb pilin [Cryobacterium sp. TMT1-19]|uniref:Flp family type IVb pilin n=1 Tax=unclassified Cryobacterium TaxID=2649013 RepID=UPI000CE438EE|nr:MULTISPECIES: Flp family type IVb pilin [unclassified Cryobacterium]TFD36171.1 Flp family type IVb pilin [Cryobacterium sp. TMT1-19]
MKFYTKIQALMNSLRTDEEGATAVEYGLMVSLIAVAIIVAVTAVGTALTALFNGVALEL